MANQRKKGKKKVAFWLTETEIGLLKQISTDKSLNMTDVVRSLLIKGSELLKSSNTKEAAK